MADSDLILNAVKNITPLDRVWRQINRIGQVRNLIKNQDFVVKEAIIKDDTVEFDYKGKKLKFYYNSDKVKVQTLGLIKENFIKEQYKDVSVKGKSVIDIGGAFGDTAIYFLLNGAEHVYCYDPDLDACNIASKNMALNGITSGVEIFSKAMDTLAEAKGLPGLRHPVLKIDCEGCEYPLLLKNRDEDILLFDEIIIEYHYGYLDLRNRLLKLGYKVKVTKPRRAMEQAKGAAGLLHAVKCR